MLRYLFGLVLLSLVDVWLLVELSGIIGFARTVVLVLLTGILGSVFVKSQAGYVIEKLGRSVSIGEASRNVLEALLLLLAGILLITPGLITDLLGFALAARPLRERFAAYLGERISNSNNVRIEFFQV